jgi:hypothetical protein
LVECAAMRKSCFRTEGVERRCGGSGADSKGDDGREDLSGFAAAWYNGNDGVVALDMLAWPAFSTWPECEASVGDDV